MVDLDLTGAEVKVLGNHGDNHEFRLRNPVGQTLISSGVDYEAQFVSHLGVASLIVLNTSRVSEGILILPVTIKTGSYKVWRKTPRRTIITIEIESR